MNLAFFQSVESILAPERLDAYRQDGVPPATTLARYLWNMALCESLYSPLQMAEIALRNSLHHFLSARYKTSAWYDVIPNLPPWQQNQLADARQKLLDEGKSVTPGSMVAELHFGFWTGFFNKSHAQTGLGHAIAGSAFPHAPRPAPRAQPAQTRCPLETHPRFAQPRFPSRAHHPLDGFGRATRRPAGSHPMGQSRIAADGRGAGSLHRHPPAGLESVAGKIAPPLA
jgi:hypothetical protein